MRYLNGADGLEVVLSLRDFNELVDELRMLTMPPVLAGLERLDATDQFIAGQLAVPEVTISDWKAGKVKLTTNQQMVLCKMLERGIRIYEDVLAGYESDPVERQFHEIGELKEHIRCADKLFNMQIKMIENTKSVPLNQNSHESAD
jgi:hypothetical protein